MNFAQDLRLEEGVLVAPTASIKKHGRGLMTYYLFFQKLPKSGILNVTARCRPLKSYQDPTKSIGGFVHQDTVLNPLCRSAQFQVKDARFVQAIGFLLGLMTFRQPDLSLLWSGQIEIIQPLQRMSRQVVMVSTGGPARTTTSGSKALTYDRRVTIAPTARINDT
jgi:hypothetical protein